MNLKIKLDKSNGRLLDREPFLIAQNDKLQIELIKEQKGILLVSLQNGDNKTNISTTGIFEVPNNLINGGRLDMVVSFYVNGALTKQWNCEPIALIEHNEKFTGHAEFNEILARLDTVNELKQKVNEMQNQIAIFENKIEALSQTVNDTAEIVNDPLN